METICETPEMVRKEIWMHLLCVQLAANFDAAISPLLIRPLRISLWELDNSSISLDSTWLQASVLVSALRLSCSM